MDFSEEQMERYSRHIILPEMGGKGQKKLLDAEVLVVGAGGLGAPVLYYLAAAGIGKLAFMDSDRVELSNLQRQIIHFTEDVGDDKSKSAADKLGKLNPDIQLEPMQKRLTDQNALDVVDDYDFVVDGTDNFSTKFLINDACVLSATPYSHAGILRFQGQAFSHRPKTACLRCLFPDPPDPDNVPSCRQAGILGVVAGMLGTIQAAETLRYFLDVGELLYNSLLMVEVKSMDFRKVKVNQNEDCPVCGDDPKITDPREINYEEPVCEF